MKSKNGTSTASSRRISGLYPHTMRLPPLEDRAVSTSRRRYLSNLPLRQARRRSVLVRL
jgi:hypothetical protein